MKISITKLKTFKACRRAYELRYIHNLVPVEKSEALTTGTDYHSKIEQLYKTGKFDLDNSKASAMATAYFKYIYPMVHIVDVETEFNLPLYKNLGFTGRVDGITDTGELVEHKTTSLGVEEFEYSIQWDEQSLGYMLATGRRKMIYTVVQKPTIRQKKTETDEEFFQRMVDWYAEDTYSKIRTFEVVHSDEEIEQFANELLQVVDDMNNCSNYYRNTAHCFRYGRKCEYAQVCLNYDETQQYINYTRREPYGNQEDLRNAD